MVRRAYIIKAVLLVGLVLLARPAAGQEPPIGRAPRQNGAAGAADALEDFVAGGRPSRLEPSAAVGVDAAYDSNVYNGRGPDMVVRVSPHFSLAYHDRRQRFVLSYDLGLWSYVTGKARASINHHALLSYDAQFLRRWAIHFADELVRAEDPAYLVRTAVIAPQTGIFDNVFEGLVGYRLTKRVDAAASYQYRVTLFDQLSPERIAGGEVQPADGGQHDLQLSSGWRVTRLDELRVAYRFQYFTIGGLAQGLSHSPSLAWQHRFRRDVDLRVEAGPLRYQDLTDRPPGDHFDGWTWRGAFLLRYFTNRWRATLSYGRDLVSGTGAGSVLWADGLSLRVGYKPTPLIDLHGSVGGFFNGLGPTYVRNFDGFNVDVGVDTQLTRNLRLSGYYSFRWQEAFDGGRRSPFPSITRSVIGLRLLVVFGAEARPPRREGREDYR
ncbi:MAG TPA: hypothetical protein VH877_27105 [Polyangia bacterium]|jgi:hypothetical protein|nr:hypothetical protein [Polyangia bacterium]